MISTARPTRSLWPSLRAIALVLGGLLLLDAATFVLAEGLWFREVNYEPVFWERLHTQISAGGVTVAFSLAVLLSNLRLARRLAWPISLNPDAFRGPGRMGLRWLLPITLLMSLVIGVMVLYHGQIAISHWHPTLSVYNGSERAPIRLNPALLVQAGGELVAQPIPAIAVISGAIALLIYPQSLLMAIAVLMSLGFGLVISEHWADILLCTTPTPFEGTDPVFGRNIGFYVFQLPVIQLLAFWLVGLTALSMMTVAVIYLLSGNSLSNGRFPGFSRPQRRHLLMLGGGLMLAVGLSYWVARYELLYSTRGVIYGASYTSVTVEVPAYTGLGILSILLGLLFLWRSAWGGEPLLGEVRRPRRGQAGRSPRPARRRMVLLHPLVLIVLYLLISGMATMALPVLVQRFVVQPTELELERPYLQQAIALTRAAFNLDEIEQETFDPQGDLTYEDLQDNELTVDNIRLWDTRPLLETNRQLQRIRPYYEFANADIDRYTLSRDDGTSQQQQVLLAARELDYNAVPEEAKTWVNQHLIYTHGYGFTMSPVNTAGEGGLPNYFIRGIEMSVSSDRIRNSIPIGQPRIYYGELTNTYIMTPTQVAELDYPSGSENVYNTYDGRGGVPIGQPWQRLIFAKHMRDWRMVLSENLTPQSKLLYRRNIMERVRAIAPFLRFDRDPYLVVADVGNDLVNGASPQAREASQNYLYWIIDAYTTSDRYPYSDPLANDINYIRNAVKVVVDAYNGSVYFFAADETDPIINSWERLFPDMFRPLRTMPPALLAHIRYPQDLFQVQSDHLMVFHMTDAQVFYNREDLWRAPREIYGNEAQLVTPYYLIMKLPAEEREEFILLRPFTPSQRTNLIAWLAARSDRVYQPGVRGDRASNMLLYQFPKQELVFGPEQIEARINQDPVISQRISLWNQRGSSAVQGNLLVIPIEQSLLYVEPLYLEATINQLPTLTRVIGAYQNRIVMAETLDAMLLALFQPASSQETIIRDLEGESDIAPLLGDDAIPLLESSPPESPVP